MASSRYLGVRRFNTLTRKVPYRRMPRQIIVVGMPREYISIARQKKEENKALANK